MARLVTIEDKNRYLFDLLFRHQVYLEGVKVGLTNDYRATLTKLYDEFAKYIGQARYTTLDQFTRTEVERFIFRFTKAQTHYYNQYTQQLIAILKQFLATDKDVLTNVYETVTGLTTTQRNNAPQTGDLPSTSGLRATHNTEAGNARLWEVADAGVIPANGLTLATMLGDWEKQNTYAVAKRVRMGYANGETPKQLLDYIVGNPETYFRDGMFSTFANQNRAIVSTAIQYLSSINNAAIASIHFNTYQWVSVLDNKTTEICLLRNGNVYIYGEGPLPPAHWFCRSKDIPMHGEAMHDIPNSFYDWLVTQPKPLLADMIGASLAAQVLDGTTKGKSISINDVVKPLTLSQFQSKIGLITA